MFRLDINGLRFIAVTMVVLFHFKFNFFYGGYAGVDVFFVISGFLMQEICSKEIGKPGWVTSFYKKRFKRIYPALLFSACFTFSLILYSETPSGVSDGFQQAISALTFTSNIYYQIFTGSYFSPTSEFNWFLHTWSLSVEWQYYLIFPLALWLSCKFNNKNWLVYLILIIASFILCIYIGPNHPKANFYLLPTRAWELMTGALVSTIKIKNKRPKTTETISIIALISFTLLSKDSEAWPNIQTLIPVAATALLLQANIGNTKTILRGFAIQKIGSASYSIYLFHWPIIAFMANNAIEFTLRNSIIGLLISVILGFLSYNYLESFFIKRERYLIVSAIIFSAVFFILDKIQISKNWTSDEIIALEGYKDYTASAGYKEQFGLDIGDCFISSSSGANASIDKKCIEPSTNKKNVLLIGDSHAAEIAGSMRKIFNEYNVMQATASGCMPFINTTGEKRCTNIMNYMYTDFIGNNKIDYIFISAFWGLSKDNNQETINKLLDTIEHVKGIKIFVIGQTKSFNMAFYKIAQKTRNNDIEALVQKKSIDINKSLISALKNKNITYINLFDSNCTDNQCNYFNAKKTPMLFDDNHLTREWSDEYVEVIKKQSGL